MSRILPLQRDAVSDPKVAAGLDGLRKKLGRIPNLFGVLAHTPVALDTYLRLGEITAGSRLSAALREQIALTVAAANGCDYCDAAHSTIGRMVGLSDVQIDAAREARADGEFEAAVLRLARQIVDLRGRIGETELEGFRQAGLDDALLLEVLVVVVVNLFTNYTNNLAGTEVDFPRISAQAA